LLSVDELWNSRDEKDWQAALDHYWKMPTVQRNLEIEKFMDQVGVEDVAKFDSGQWCDFLYLYFIWKFSGCYLDDRLADLGKNSPEQLARVRASLLDLEEFDLQNVVKCLKILKAPNVKGLGFPGASGLFALLFKGWYGTVDKYAVESLCEIKSLPQRERIQEIDAWLKKGQAWRESDAALVVDIMRRKARELNDLFGTDRWTPRKIDMILWAWRNNDSSGRSIRMPTNEQTIAALRKLAAKKENQ
jgi:hypothetical protein